LKKICCFVWMAALFLCLLTGCSAKAPVDAPIDIPEVPAEAHQHVPEAGWAQDAKDHWQYCACGEQLNTAAHTFTDGRCDTCNCEVWDMGDIVNIVVWDDFGNVLSVTDVDTEGNVLSFSSYEYIYDENGNVLEEKYFFNDILMSLREYRVIDGSSYVLRDTGYNDDGTTSVNEYNEQQSLIRYASMAEDGTLLYEAVYGYTLNAAGEEYLVTETTTDYAAEVTYVSEYNEYGDQTKVLTYDLAGDLQEERRFEREYDSEGQRLREKTYVNNMLVQEIPEYKTFEDENSSMRFPASMTEYFEDGSKLVSLFNDRGDLEAETTYDAAGKVVKENRSEYEYNEDGCIRHRHYENGRLVLDTEYSMDEEGFLYPSKVTEYDENGNKTVQEYASGEAAFG